MMTSDNNLQMVLSLMVVVVVSENEEKGNSLSKIISISGWSWYNITNIAGGNSGRATRRAEYPAAHFGGGISIPYCMLFLYINKNTEAGASGLRNFGLRWKLSMAEQRLKSATRSGIILTLWMRRIQQRCCRLCCGGDVVTGNAW